MRRPDASSHLRALVHVDRASVWRSRPLRRGLVVLALLPGGLAAVSHVGWSSLPLLPGLVAAGSGLLFGVNMFCLDGAGGLWLGSLPHSGLVSAASKVAVTAETCLVAVLIAVAAATSRVPGPPTTSEATALLSSIVACTALVIATCTSLSVHRPHRADLRGPRDAPAPPASMAVYSLRLAFSTTIVATLFVGAGESGLPLAGPLICVPVLLWAVRSVVRSMNAFAAPQVRAQILVTVALG